MAGDAGSSVDSRCSSRCCFIRREKRTKRERGQAQGRWKKKEEEGRTRRRRWLPVKHACC